VQKMRGVTASYDLSPRDSKRPSSSDVDAEKESGIPEWRCAQKLDCSEGKIPSPVDQAVPSPRARISLLDDLVRPQQE
jgi:hypothetical protein